MKVSFSLASAKSKAPAAPAAAKPVGDAPSLKKPVAFASLDDDEPVDAAATAGGSTSRQPNKQLIAQNVGMSKSLKRQLEEEKQVDATVFEYDEVWDKMQEAKLRQKMAKEADSKERKVRS
jgi:coiled-coil domain-containing protein 55